MELIQEIWQGSGLYQLTPPQRVMILVGLALLYLAIVKKFEPLLLVTIGFGGILSNIPGVEIATGDGLLHLVYMVGIETGAFPLIIFMGVGAMTDFGPLLANPKTLFLGAAAQFGIFATLLGALGLTAAGIFDFSIQEAAAIGIIGGADGPTAIYVAGMLAPDLLGAIAVAAYSYMALVPLIQPPIMKALTSEEERRIEMVQLREVSRTERSFGVPMMGRFSGSLRIATMPTSMVRSVRDCSKASGWPWSGMRSGTAAADPPGWCRAGFERRRRECPRRRCSCRAGWIHWRCCRRTGTCTGSRIPRRCRRACTSSG